MILHHQGQEPTSIEKSAKSEDIPCSVSHFTHIQLNPLKMIAFQQFPSLRGFAQIWTEQPILPRQKSTQPSASACNANLIPDNPVVCLQIASGEWRAYQRRRLMHPWK